MEMNNTYYTADAIKEVLYTTYKLPLRVRLCIRVQIVGSNIVVDIMRYLLWDTHVELLAVK